MRLTRIIVAAMAAPALLLAACGPEGASGASTGPAANLQGDDVLIAAAQTISDAMGGCVKPDGAVAESRVVGLEDGSVVMLACGQDASVTHRLFAVRGGGAPSLLSLPDYDAGGWFASDQVSMAEIDAGTGVLTTMRKSADNDSCGSEGRYQWDGAKFVLQEVRWKGCSADDLTGPPFPVIWPTQQGAAVDPNGATPAP